MDIKLSMINVVNFNFQTRKSSKFTAWIVVILLLNCKTLYNAVEIYNGKPIIFHLFLEIHTIFGKITTLIILYYLYVSCILCGNFQPDFLQCQ